MGKRRKVGWDDETIVGGFRGDDENKFRAKFGITQVIRLLTAAEEYRVHKVDDVREPDEEGNPQSFNANCSCEWDDEANDGDGDWVGDCDGCEKEYEVNPRYVCGLILVGTYGKSKKFKKVDPDEASLYWDFAPQTYAKIRSIKDDLKRGKKKAKRLAQVELLVSVGSKRDETFQDVNIRKNDEAEITGDDLREYIAEWKEVGPKMIDEAAAPTPKSEWTRRLKKNKKKRRDPDDDDLDGLDDEDEDETPKRKAKKKAKKKTKKKPRRKAKKEDEEEPEDDDTEDDDINDILSELDD